MPYPTCLPVTPVQREFKVVARILPPCSQCLFIHGQAGGGRWGAGNSCPPLWKLSFGAKGQHNRGRLDSVSRVIRHTIWGVLRELKFI